MSKYVKNLQLAHVRREFARVDDMVFVDVIGLNSKETVALRNEFHAKGIRLEVVKNTLLSHYLVERGLPACKKVLKGSAAVAYGGEGIVELARDLTQKARKVEKFEIKGGCVSGQELDKAGIESLSKYPSRLELIGTILGQILAPGANLAGQLLGPGGTLASQIEEHAKKLGGGDEAPANDAPASEG